MEAQELFVRDFAVVMFVAGVALLIFHRFKQPNILGYIVTGFLLGPHTPALFGLGLKNKENLEMMSDMAIVLLMFSLGLEFSIRKYEPYTLLSSLFSTSISAIEGSHCKIKL